MAALARFVGTHVELPVGQDGALPTEFRVFAAGWNDTTKGPLLFDDVACAAVMTAWRRHGVDVAIDLNHDSIDDAARASRDDAADARGWCVFEVRPGPELWATHVRWTPDGARRLVDQTQRYISPVAFFDADTLRVTEIFNLALVATPAMHNAPALVASRGTMDPKLIQQALDALIEGDAAACAEILKQLVASAAGAEEPEAEPAPEPAVAEATSQPEDEPPDPAAAMARALITVLKADSPAGVVAEVKRMRTELDALKLARNADEHNERIGLVGELVTLGAELPCTAWADADAMTPSDDLASMPLAKLRARVAAFRASPRESSRVTPPNAPPSLDIASLSDVERARAEAISDPAARARFVAARISRMGSK